MRRPTSLIHTIDEGLITPNDTTAKGGSEWKLHLRGRIIYRQGRQPTLPNFLYSSSTTSWRLTRRGSNNDNNGEGHRVEARFHWCAFPMLWILGCISNIADPGKPMKQWWIKEQRCRNRCGLSLVTCLEGIENFHAVWSSANDATKAYRLQHGMCTSRVKSRLD